MILSTIVLEDRQSLPCFTNSCPCIDFKKKKERKSCSCCALTGKNRNKGSCSRVQFEKWWNHEKKRSERRKQKRNKGMIAQAVFFYSLAALFLAMLSRETRPNAIDTFFGLHTSQICLPPFCLFQQDHLAGIARKMNAYQRFFSSLLGQRNRVFSIFASNFDRIVLAILIKRIERI